MKKIEQACHDILSKNMEYQWKDIYLLYDTESPLARMLAEAYRSVLPRGAIIREFRNPPQPLYRGGMINPDNPHADIQKRVVTSHNISENIALGLNHHKKLEAQSESIIDPEIESIKDGLTSLPVGSVVILVQSTNFRLSTFRIRLELFHRGVHVVEHNHLAYIPEEEFETFIDSLGYRTDEYIRLEHGFRERIQDAEETKIISSNSCILTFWPLENIRGNTGDYTGTENKGGTFPIGEVFTEAQDLSSVNGKILIDTYPNEDFSLNICEPFELIIEKWRVLPSSHFPSKFQRIYELIVQFEWEVLVRELGFGLNPAISTTTPLSDVNFYERKLWVHLSLGKKHGIYGKKLPKTEVQRFHIDVFVSLETVEIQKEKIFQDGKWIL
jgi:aminopeptidase